MLSPCFLSFLSSCQVAIPSHDMGMGAAVSREYSKKAKTERGTLSLNGPRTKYNTPTHTNFQLNGETHFTLLGKYICAYTVYNEDIHTCIQTI